MTIEDPVEDYVIYAYFELDHPHRCYVGKTLQSRAEQRDQEHRSGDSGAPKFNAFVLNEIIYGNRDFDDVLRYKILEHFTGTAKECAEREGEHIQRKNSIENGWNLKTEGKRNGNPELPLALLPAREHEKKQRLRKSISEVYPEIEISDEIIQDAIEFGLEQSILEKDKEYNFQELEILIAKSYAAQTYQTLNQTLNIPNKEPSPNEVMSVVNKWKSDMFHEQDVRHKEEEKWWKKQLTKSGFERPFDWKTILKTTREAFEKADLDSPLIQWLKGNVDRIDNDEFPQQDRKWVCYGSSKDVWRLIRDAFLAEFPNTLQEIAEKEEAARLQREQEERERLQREGEEQERIEREKEERERIQREKEEQERLKAEQDRESTPWWERPHKPSLVESVREAQERLEREREEKERFQRGMEEKEEAIGKVAERMEKERIQRVAQAKPDLAIVEKQVTRAGSGAFECIIFSIISIIFIICVLVSCIEE